MRRHDADPDAAPADWLAFLREHEERVSRAVRRVCPDDDRAAEIAAEVLERFHADWPALVERFRRGGGRRFGPWLAVVARNSAIDALRRRRGRSEAEAPQVTHLPDADGVDEAEPGELLVRSAAAAALGQLFSDLSGDERTLLRLYFLEGRDAESLRRLFGGRTRSQIYNRVHDLSRRLGEAARRAGLGADDVEHLARLDWSRFLRSEEGPASDE